MQEHHSFADMFIELISKSWTWILGIWIGIAAKLSTELLMKRKLNTLQWVGIIGLSVFAGYLTSVYCANHDMQKQGQYLVPMATLFGEKITMYCIANYKRFFDLFVQFITKKEK